MRSFTKIKSSRNVHVSRVDFFKKLTKPYPHSKNILHILDTKWQLKIGSSSAAYFMPVLDSWHFLQVKTDVSSNDMLKPKMCHVNFY